MILRCLHSDRVCPRLRTPQRPHVIHLRRRHPCSLRGAAPSGPLPPCTRCLLFSCCPAHSGLLAPHGPFLLPPVLPRLPPHLFQGFAHTAPFRDMSPGRWSILGWPQDSQSPCSSFLLLTALGRQHTLYVTSPLEREPPRRGVACSWRARPGNSPGVWEALSQRLGGGGGGDPCAPEGNSWDPAPRRSVSTFWGTRAAS